jgi:hypothetical protein
LQQEIACKKYIDDILMLHKNTPIANKVKTPMHVTTNKLKNIPKLQTLTNALKYKN